MAGQMSNETDKTGSRAEPAVGTPTGSRSRLAVWVSPKVIDTPIASKTGKGSPFPENQPTDTGPVYKVNS